MIIVNGITYPNYRELARALATRPELRDLRDEVIRAVVQRPDSPVAYKLRLRNDALEVRQ